MSIITRMLKDTATYWPVITDGYGGFEFGAPVAISCRWEEVQEEFITPEGREEVSDAVVYVDRDLEVGGYLAQGDYSASTSTTTTGEEPSFTPPDSARPIKQFSKLPKLRYDEYLRTCYLGTQT